MKNKKNNRHVVICRRCHDHVPLEHTEPTLYNGALYAICHACLAEMEKGRNLEIIQAKREHRSVRLVWPMRTRRES